MTFYLNIFFHRSLIFIFNNIKKELYIYIYIKEKENEYIYDLLIAFSDKELIILIKDENI